MEDRGESSVLRYKRVKAEQTTNLGVTLSTQPLFSLFPISTTIINLAKVFSELLQSCFWTSISFERDVEAWYW